MKYAVKSCRCCSCLNYLFFCFFFFFFERWYGKGPSQGAAQEGGGEGAMTGASYLWDHGKNVGALRGPQMVPCSAESVAHPGPIYFFLLRRCSPKVLTCSTAGAGAGGGGPAQLCLLVLDIHSPSRQAV